jgi:hypothetical protein
MAEKGDIRVIRSDAGERLADKGQQLGLFGADGAPVPVEERRGAGRPPGAPNKLKAKLREYLAHKGYRDPAEQLAMLAGLDQQMHPLAYAAHIAQVLGEDVMAVAREMRQAAGELMPYWHAKITPDVSVQAPAVNILMQGASGAVGMAIEGTDPFAPLNVRLGQMQQNQQVADIEDPISDTSDRTE